MSDQITQAMLGLEVLKSQGVDTRELEAALRQGLSKRQPNSMSTTDAVYVSQSTPEVPGAYVDAYQKQQDIFNEQLEMKLKMDEDMAQTNGMNAPINPIVSPNYTVVQSPQRVTVGPQGQIIYM
jgi:hypothetical protein